MTSASKFDGAALADRVQELACDLPDGASLVIFMIIDMGGGSFASTVAATRPPNEFAPVVRRWLERYDAGELMATDGLRATRKPDA